MVAFAGLVAVAAGPVEPAVAAPASPDLAVSVSHVGNFVTGGYGRWDIVVTNTSAFPTDGSTVTVSDILPPELATWIGGRGHYPVGWSGSLDDLVYSRSDVLEPGESYPPVILVIEIPASLDHQVVNTATVTGGGDESPGNNTATDPTDFSGYLSRYSSPELALVDRVATFLGNPSRENAQTTGALFLAYLDGLIQAQHLTPPAFGSDWPAPGYRQEPLVSEYTPEQLALVKNTAARFSSDVPTLQRRGALLIAYLISLPHS